MPQLSAGAGDEGRRLDRVLRKALPELPLSLIHRFLRQGRILVDGEPAEASGRVKAGSTITVPDTLPGTPRRDEPPHHTSPLPLDILSETSGLLILNKPAGIAVHGEDSLDTAVQAWLKGKIPPSLSFKPGPLHRLDRPTSGVVVFSANLEGARSFSALIREGKLTKRYLAIVDGLLVKDEIWEDDLVRERRMKKTFVSDTAGTPAGKGGENAPKHARTCVRPLAHAAGHAKYTLILAEIATGRTHQIRAQAAARGFPLSGDAKYGGSPQKGGFLLHAWTLDFPAAEGPAHIEAPLPGPFRKKIALLFPGFTFPPTCAVSFSAV